MYLDCICCHSRICIYLLPFERTCLYWPSFNNLPEIPVLVKLSIVYSSGKAISLDDCYLFPPKWQHSIRYFMLVCIPNMHLKSSRLLNVLFMFQEESFTVGLKLLPFIYAITVAINLFSVFYKGSHCKLFGVYSIFTSIDNLIFHIYVIAA